MTIWQRLKRWRESRANLQRVARLDDRARAEFEALVRLRRDGLEGKGEFKSKERSVVRGASADIAANAREAHS